LHTRSSEKTPTDEDRGHSSSHIVSSCLARNGRE